MAELSNDELALRVYRWMDEECKDINEATICEFARRYDAAKLEAMQPEVKEMIKKLRSPAQVFYEYKCDSGLQLTDAADLIERLATALTRETERADYGWKNVAILEKAFQEEMKKRDDCEKRLATAQGEK